MIYFSSFKLYLRWKKIVCLVSRSFEIKNFWNTVLLNTCFLEKYCLTNESSPKILLNNLHRPFTFRLVWQTLASESVLLRIRPRSRQGHAGVLQLFVEFWNESCGLSAISQTCSGFPCSVFTSFFPWDLFFYWSYYN